MKKVKIIDVHAHIFPDEIAEKASVNIGEFYYIPMKYDAKVSTLLKIGKDHQIDQFVVHSVATQPGQVKNINEFIIESVKKHPDKFIGFATLHPDFNDIENEVEKAISLGLKGIKLHPDFQRFNIDDKNAYKIYEIIEGRLPLLVHTGDYRYPYSKPTRLIKVMSRFPRLQVIGAHFGGWSEWGLAAKELADKNMYIDTSSSLYALTPQKARDLIYNFGIDHVLFGTDYPMWDAGREIEYIKSLELSESEMEKIFHLNLENLLNLV